MAKLEVAEESLTLGPIDPAAFTGREEDLLFSGTSLFGFSGGAGIDIDEGCLSFQANESLPQGSGAASRAGGGGKDGADTACPKAPSLLQSLNAVINKTASARKARTTEAAAVAAASTTGTSETTKKRYTRKTRKAKPKPSGSPRHATSDGAGAKASDVGLEASDNDGGDIKTRRRTRGTSRLRRDSRKGDGDVFDVAAGNLSSCPASHEVEKAQAPAPRGETSDGQGQAIVNKGDSGATEALEAGRPTHGGNKNPCSSPTRTTKLHSCRSDATESSAQTAARKVKQSNTDEAAGETDRQALAPAPESSSRDYTMGVGEMELIPGFEDTIDLQFMTAWLQCDEGEASLGLDMASADDDQADLQGSLGLADVLLQGCDTQSDASVTKSDSAEDRRNNKGRERKEDSRACEALVTQKAAADEAPGPSTGNDVTRGLREAVEVIAAPSRKQTAPQAASTPTTTSTLSPALLPSPAPLSPIPLANVPGGYLTSRAKPTRPVPGGSSAEKHGSGTRQGNDLGVTPSSRLSLGEGAAKDATTVSESEKNVWCESVEGTGKEAAASIDGQAERRCHSDPDRSGSRAIEAMPPPGINVGVRRCHVGEMEKNSTARAGARQRIAVTTPGAENSGETGHEASEPGSSGRGRGDGVCPSSSQSASPRIPGGEVTGTRIGGSAIPFTEERPENGAVAPPGPLPRKVSLRFAPRERSTEEKVAKQGYLPFQKLTAPLSKPLEAVFKFMRKKWREVATSDLNNVRIVCDAVATVESTERSAANRATFVWGTERSGYSLARLVNSLPEAARARLCKEEFLDLTYTFLSGAVGPPPCDLSSVWNDSSGPAAVASSVAPRSSSMSTTPTTKSNARSAPASLTLPSPMPPPRVVVPSGAQAPTVVMAKGCGDMADDVVVVKAMMPPPAAVRDLTSKRARTVDGNENPAAAAAAAAAAASAAAAVAAATTGSGKPILEGGARKRTRRAPNEKKIQLKKSAPEGVKEMAPKTKRPGRYPRSIRPTVSLADAVCGRSLVGDSFAARLAEIASRSGGLAGRMFAAMHSMAVADGLRAGQPTDWASWPPLNTLAASPPAPWLARTAPSAKDSASGASGPAAMATATAPACDGPVTENPVQKLDEVKEAPAVTDGAETEGRDMCMNLIDSEIIGEDSCIAAFSGCEVDLLMVLSPTPNASEESAAVARTVVDQEGAVGRAAVDVEGAARGEGSRREKTDVSPPEPAALCAGDVALSVSVAEANRGDTEEDANEASGTAKRPLADGMVKVISAAEPAPPRQESDESASLLGAQPTEIRLDQKGTDGTNTGECEETLSTNVEQLQTVSISPAAGMTPAALDAPEATIAVEPGTEGDADAAHPTASSGRAKEVSPAYDARETPNRDATLASKEAKPSDEVMQRASPTPGATQESNAGFDTSRLTSYRKPLPLPLPPTAVETLCVSSQSEVSTLSARSECEEKRACTRAPSTPQPSSGVGGCTAKQKNACASGHVDPPDSSSFGCFQAEPRLDAGNFSVVGTGEGNPCLASEMGCSILMEAAAVIAAGEADGSEGVSDREEGVSRSDAGGESFGKPRPGEQLVSKKAQEAPSPVASAQVPPQKAHITASMKGTPPQAAANANSTNTDVTMTTASPRASGSTPVSPRPFAFAAVARNDADRVASPGWTASEAAAVLTSMNAEPSPTNNARSASSVAASDQTPETPQSCDGRSLIGEKAMEHATREQVQASYAEAWSSFPNCCFWEESLAGKDAGAGGNAKQSIVREDLMARWLALPHAEVALDGMISISPASTAGGRYDDEGLKGLTPTSGGFFAISPRRDGSGSFFAISPRRDNTPVSASSCRSSSYYSDDLRCGRATERATEETDSLPTLIRLGRSMSKGLTPVKSEKEATAARNSGFTDEVTVAATNPDSAPVSPRADSAPKVTAANSLTANGCGGGGGGDNVDHRGRISRSSNKRGSRRKRRGRDHRDDSKDIENRVGHGSRGGEKKGADVSTRPKKRSKRARITPTFVGSLSGAALSAAAPAFSRG